MSKLRSLNKTVPRPTVCFPSLHPQVLCDKAFPCGRCYSHVQHCQPPLELLELWRPDVMVDVILARHEPLVQVEAYLRAFHALFAEGRVDRSWAKRSL